MHHKSQIKVHSCGNPAQFCSIPVGVPRHLFPSPREPRNTSFHPRGIPVGSAGFLQSPSPCRSLNYIPCACVCFIGQSNSETCKYKTVPQSPAGYGNILLLVWSPSNICFLMQGSHWPVKSEKVGELIWPVKSELCWCSRKNDVYRMSCMAEVYFCWRKWKCTFIAYYNKTFMERSRYRGGGAD